MRTEPFARRLKRIRESAGLSVAELAAKCGLRRETIHRYESGDREPLLSQARKLAKALGISLVAFE